MAKKYVPVLYLACLLSPVAFLLGYVAGAPKDLRAPHLEFGGIDSRRLSTDARDVHDSGSILMDDRLRLTPNTDYQLR